MYVVNRSLQYDLTRRNVFPDELQVYAKYHQMLARIPLLILLMTIIYGCGSIMLDRYDGTFLLTENPLIIAAELVTEGRMEEVLYLAQFSNQYLPVDDEYSSAELERQANEALQSPWYVMEHFATGALTGEANDTAGFVGTMALDLLVIGDIRDLLVQGYKEFDNGQGDEVIMGLSAAGLLLTLIPELSWTPSMFKTFWRGKRFSGAFQKQLQEAVLRARKTGNTQELSRLMSHFSDVVDGLGTGPAMNVFKHVSTVEDLAQLASKAKIAPLESYSLVSINGIKALENVSTTGVKQGKLLKRVKLASRQQKLFTKVLALVPDSWILIVFCISLLLFYIVFTHKN